MVGRALAEHFADEGDHGLPGFQANGVMVSGVERRGDPAEDGAAFFTELTDAFIAGEAAVAAGSAQ